MPKKIGYAKKSIRMAGGYGGGSGKKKKSPTTGPGRTKATSHSVKYSIPKGRMKAK